MFAIKQQEVDGVWSLESTKTEDFLQMGLAVNCQTVKKSSANRQKWKIFTVNRQLYQA